MLYELLTGAVPFTGDTPVEIAMKHLSATPAPPSEKRPDIPDSLEMVILRGLAKDPTARYQNAEEMDADLERVDRGLRVSRETEDAATTVLRGASFPDTAATMVVPSAAATIATGRPPGPPTREYFDYDEPARRRPIWPWLLAVLLVAGAAIAGVYVYEKIQDQLDQAQPIGVPYLVAIKEANAVQIVRDLGLKTGPDAHQTPCEQ